jgi:hypothetical protein
MAGYATGRRHTNENDCSELEQVSLHNANLD